MIIMIRIQVVFAVLVMVSCVCMCIRSSDAVPFEDAHHIIRGLVGKESKKR
jgi:hypothetical protein